MINEEVNNQAPSLESEAEIFEKWFLIPSIRYIALTYSVSTSKLYEVVNFCEQILLQPSREAVMRKCFNRLASIVAQLALTPYNNEEGLVGRNKCERLFLDTVFSKELPALMMSEYTTFASLVDAPPILQGYEKLLRVRKNTNQIEGEADMKFAFGEAITLACLYLSHHNRAVLKLNRPITTQNEQKRARGRFKRVKEQLESKQLRDAFIRLFLDLSRIQCEDAHAFMTYQYTREYRLPRKFRITKDIRYAVSHHYIPYDSIDRSYWTQQSRKEFQEQHQTLEYAKRYAKAISPLVELILTRTIPNDISIEDSSSVELDLRPYIQGQAKIDYTAKRQKEELGIETVSARDYRLACKVAKTVDCYMTQAFASARYLLSLLEEANSLSTVPFLEYYNKI